MTIQKKIDELFQDVVNTFEDDGMRVTMPKYIREALRAEMANRLCASFNEIRDDIEMDVRAFAKVK